MMDLAPGGTYLEGYQEYQHEKGFIETSPFYTARAINRQDNKWRQKEVKGFYVMCDFAQPTDTVEIWLQMDEGVDITLAAKEQGAPFYVPVNRAYTGMKMQAWLKYKQEQGTVHCPVIVGVVVDFEYTGEPLEFVPKAAATAKPETT